TFRLETSRASQVLGESSCAFALLSDPGRTDSTGHTTKSARPPLCPQRTLPQLNQSFGAPSHGLDTRCLRFVRCLATRDARLASHCWPLYGTGLVARRILMKGFRPLSS